MIAPLVAALALSAAFGVSSDSGEAGSERTLRIARGFDFDAGSVGDRVAAEVMRRSTGIKSRLSVLSSPRNTIIALERGDIDVAMPGINSTIQAIQQGAKMRAVLLTGMVSEDVLVASVPQVADLRGKRIGYHDEGETKLLAEVLLARAGLKAADVELIQLPESTNRATALVAGRLDAAVLAYVDFLRISREKPDLRLLGTARGVIPFSAARPLVVSEKLRGQRDRMQRIVTGMLAGYEFLYTPAGRREWLATAKRTALKDETDASRAQIYAFYRGIGVWPRRNRIPTPAEWQQGTDFRILRGILKPPAPSFTQMFDFSFWRRAAEK